MNVREVFEAYYGRRSADEVHIPSDAPYLHSYVPYVVGQTNVIAYNFLRNNYNLRDPVLLEVWVNAGGAGTERVALRRVFAPDEVVHLGPHVLDGLAGDGVRTGSVHLRVLHPRVATFNGEFRFLAFYHVPGAACAGIHSLGARGLNALGPSFGSRAVVPRDRAHRAVDPEAIHMVEPSSRDRALSPVRPSPHPLRGPAFFVSTDNKDRVTAVWHDSDMTQTLGRAREPRVKCRIRQAFPIPDFPRSAPLVWVSADQIGFMPERLRIYVTDARGSLLAERVVGIVEAPGIVDLAAVFADLPMTGTACAVVDLGEDHGSFDAPALGYLHLWYPGPDGPGDQVHSQITPSYWTDQMAEPVSYRCRKFAPWCADPTLDWTYAVVNVGGNGGNRDCAVRFRILTDRRHEAVVDLPLPDERVGLFSADQLFASCRLPPAGSAIIQIEAEATNFNAFWMARDRASGACGIDHFTGG